MNTFSLKIIACDKVFYDGEAEIVIFPGYDGEMAVMANHEQMTASIEIGEIRFRTSDGNWMEAVTSMGLITVAHNKVDILVYSAEKPEGAGAAGARGRLRRRPDEQRVPLRHPGGHGG